MKNKLFRQTLCAVLSVGLLLFCGAAFAENIDPNDDGSQYAYGQNVGWINLEPSYGPGVTVADSAVTGYAWAENIGWINLSPTDYGGVTNDGNGNLSGYAWGENVGWINFEPDEGGVTIDPLNGNFSGKAWGENIGWISFASEGAISYGVTTSWTANEAPTVSSVSKSGDEDTTITFAQSDFTTKFSDIDTGDSLTKIKVTSLPSHGTLKVGESAVSENDEIDAGELGNLTYTPNENYNGPDSFGWNGFDGTEYAAAGAMVNITVTAVNDAPTISDIADQSTNEDTATSAISFTVGDVETSAGDLTLSGSSSNTPLVPNANIVFGGSDANRTVTITPATNQHGMATITVTVSDGTASSSDTFTLTVSTVYTVTFTAGANGGLTGTADQMVTEGSDCTAVTAIPDTGYHFTGWTGDYTGTENPLTLTNVTAAMNITANFAINTYTITASAGANGGITPSGNVSVNHGSNQIFTITPDANYHVADVLVDGLSLGPLTTYTFVNVTADGHTIEATFAIGTFTLTMAKSGTGEGTVSPDVGQHIYDEGTAVNIQATPNAGSKFDHWDGDVADPTSASTTVTMDGVKTVTAYFVKTDQEAPVASIINAPTGITNATQYSVSIGGIDVISYMFKVDEGTWSDEITADVPLTFTITTGEDHTLYVIGKDAADNWQTQANATTATWTVDTTPPVATIESYPRGTIGTTSIDVIVGGTDVQFYKYRIDGGSWSPASPVTTPIKVSDLAEGTHTLDVIGLDTPGNWQKEADATTATWSIDTSVPTAVLSNLPDRITKETSASIPVGGEDVVAYRYNIEGPAGSGYDGTWSDELSIQYTIEVIDLADGAYTLYINAKNSAGTWQDGDDGNEPTSATVYSWTVDTTASEAVTTLDAAAGVPPSTVIELSWPGVEDGLRGYYVKYSESQITEANWDDATTLFSGITPGPAGHVETFTVRGLSPNTTYYFAVKSVDAAGNVSDISNVASWTTAMTLPSITSLVLTEGGDTGDNSIARELTITGTNLVGGEGNIVRFISSTAVFDVTSNAGSTTEIYADVPAGAPVGTYNIRVINMNGTSALSEQTYTVTEAPTPLPEVTNVSPAVGTPGQTIDIEIGGSNFTDATAFKFATAGGVALTQTAGLQVTDTRITASFTLPADLAEDRYDIQVHTPNGHNTVSAVKLEVYDPVDLSTSTGTTTTTGGVDMPDDGIVPVELTLSTDNREEVAPVSANKMEIEVRIDPGTEITLADGTPYTGAIDPPRQVPLTEEIEAQLGSNAVIFTMGSQTQKLELGEGQTMFVKVDITMPSSAPEPSIYYLEADGSLTLAGVDGERDGQTIKKGGTVLATQVGVPEDDYTTYTFGLLLDHMSEFAAGAKAAPAPTVTTESATEITSSSVILNGTVNPNGESTTYYFEYGTSTSYGSNTPTTSAGSGTADVSVSANITGLSPNTTYHFRIVATNSAGTSYGSDKTFITEEDDSDGDGLPDNLEMLGCTDPNDADTDDDSILDGWEDANHNGVVDSGESNPCNIDTDGDGIQDGTELSYTLNDIGLDTDLGIFQPDLDPTTTTDPLNPDTDGDGRSDGQEDVNYNGRVDAGETDSDAVERFVGSGEAYATIQSAVNAASSGDSVIVTDGTYTENVNVNKTLTIQSENGTDVTTVQAANVDANVFNVTVDYVNISGFTVQGATGGGGALFSGIRLCEASYCAISDNKALNNDFGIHLTDYSINNDISNNEVSNNMWGIRVYRSNDNNISDNNISSNSVDGINVTFGSSNNNISNNDISNNGQDGIYLWESNNNTLSGNSSTSSEAGIHLARSSNNNILSSDISNNNGYGIYLRDSSNGNNISNNNVSGNSWHGIVLSLASNGNKISNNNVVNNNFRGILLNGTSDNTIYLNNFSDNSDGNVNSIYSTNIWHSPTPMSYDYTGGSLHKGYLGNYYGDHTLTDSDGDGITDSVYDLPGIEPDDEYPLAATSDNYSLKAWWLHSDSIMYQDDMNNPPGSVTIAAGSSDVWIADQAAEISMDFSETDVWNGQIVFTSAPATGYTFTVEIGSSTDGSDFNPGGPDATVTGDDSNTVFIYQTDAAAFSVPVGNYLAIRITNNSGSDYDVSTGGAWSYITPGGEESVDSDGDGLPDDLENTTCTDPNNLDTDNDGIIDGVEDANHNGLVDSDETDPCKSDTDGDDLPDGWEVDNELNPLDATGDNGGDGDPDNDAYSNLEEYYAGTNPNDIDSKPVQKGDIDGDGNVDLADAILALQVLAGLNPEGIDLGADVDEDGQIGLAEVIYILQNIARLR